MKAKKQTMHLYNKAELKNLHLKLLEYHEALCNLSSENNKCDTPTEK